MVNPLETVNADDHDLDEIDFEDLFEEEDTDEGPQVGVDEVTQSHWRGDADGFVTREDIEVTIHLEVQGGDYDVDDDAEILREFRKRSAAAEPEEPEEPEQPATHVLPHAEVYAPMASKAELARIKRDIDVMLARDGSVSFKSLTNAQRRGKFGEAVSFLTTLLRALGLDPTLPDYPASYDFEYGKLKVLLGHFETSTLKLTHLKQRREYVTKDGEVILICKSRVWNVWRRGVGDDVFDNVFLWNVIPWKAHAHADSKALDDNKGRPLVTTELLAEPAYRCVEKLVIRILRIIGGKLVVSMGEKARQFIKRNSVEFSFIVPNLKGDVFTDPAHACWIIDRALLRHIHDSAPIYVAKQHHFYAYGVAFGMLLENEEMGMERAQELLERIRRKWRIEVDGEWIPLPPEEQFRRAKERRQQWLRQPKPGCPCLWNNREYRLVSQRTLQCASRTRSPCGWAQREYRLVYQRTLRCASRTRSPCGWAVREYQMVYKRTLQCASRMRSPCGWAVREYKMVYKRTLQCASRMRSPCGWAQREYQMVYKRTFRCASRMRSPCGWAVREYWTVSQRLSGLDKRRVLRAAEHGFDPTREPLAWCSVAQLEDMAREAGIVLSVSRRRKTKARLVKDLIEVRRRDFAALLG